MKHSNPPPSDSRAARQNWLDLGFQVLAEDGEKALTIENLCQRMKRTKGSFYHHFKGRKAFVQGLMDHWERRDTLRMIDEMAPFEDPMERLIKLGEMTTREVDLRLERAMRVWAERDPSVRERLEKIDRAREGYLREQFEAALGDRRRANLAARCHMALLVGTQMLYQDLSREELKELNAFAERLGVETVPAKGQDKGQDKKRERHQGE